MYTLLWYKIFPNSKCGKEQKVLGMKWKLQALMFFALHHNNFFKFIFPDIYSPYVSIII